MCPWSETPVLPISKQLIIHKDNHTKNKCNHPSASRVTLKPSHEIPMKLARLHQLLISSGS